MPLNRHQMNETLAGPTFVHDQYLPTSFLPEQKT